jgi:hypothetical protein
MAAINPDPRAHAGQPEGLSRDQPLHRRAAGAERQAQCEVPADDGDALRAGSVRVRDVAARKQRDAHRAQGAISRWFT